MNINKFITLFLLLIFSISIFSQEIQNVHLHFDNNRNMGIIFDANAANGKKVKITNVEIINGENVFHNPTVSGDIFHLFSNEKNRKILWYAFQDMQKIVISGRISVQLYYTVYNENMQEMLKNSTIFTQNVTNIKCPDKEMMYASIRDKKQWQSFAKTSSVSPLTEIQSQTLKQNLVAENPFHKKVDINMIYNNGIEADATYSLTFVTTSHFEVQNEDITVLFNGKPYEKLAMERSKLDSLSVQFEQKLQLMGYVEKGNPDVKMEILINKQGVISAFQQTLRFGNMRPYDEIYALVVGIDEYNEATTSFGKLKCAKEGAAAFVDCLEKKLMAKKENIRFLTEDMATKYIILDSLKRQVKRCTDRDLLVFYFAGHGNKEGFIPYNYEFINQSTALFYSEIKEILKTAKAKNIILLCDAEFSDHFLGENDGDFSVGLLASSDKDVPFFLFNNNQTVFNHYIISGLEGEADGNGNGLVSIKELSEYVIQNTKSETLEGQSPIGKATNNEIIIGNFR